MWISSASIAGGGSNMAAQSQTVGLVEINSARVDVTKATRGYTANIWANRKFWSGSGASVAAAIEAALDDVRNEKRASEKGRNSKRYRIARSILSGR